MNYIRTEENSKVKTSDQFKTRTGLLQSQLLRLLLEEQDQYFSSSFLQIACTLQERTKLATLCYSLTLNGSHEKTQTNVVLVWVSTHNLIFKKAQ